MTSLRYVVMVHRPMSLQVVDLEEEAALPPCLAQALQGLLVSRLGVRRPRIERGTFTLTAPPACLKVPRSIRGRPRIRQ